MNELPLCACGCGQRVSKLGNKYIRGHYFKNKVNLMSEQHKINNAKAQTNKIFSEERLNNMSKAIKKYYEYNKNWAYGRVVPKEEIIKRLKTVTINKSFVGENNPRYIDGRKQKEINFRQGVLERENYTCQCCGEYGKYVHHGNDRKFYSEDLYNIDAGYCLCIACHSKLHNGFLYQKKLISTIDLTNQFIKENKGV